jgi:type VI secretion system protein
MTDYQSALMKAGCIGSPGARQHTAARRPAAKPSPTLRGIASLLMMACVAGLLSGCALPSFMSFKGDKVKWAQVTLSASDNVNNNSPVAVDVVLVMDDALLARLSELPASKWFAARTDLASTFPNGVRYRSWEVVPGQRIIVPGGTFAGPRVAAAFVFAHYPDPGAHRVRIEQFSGRLAVQLDNNTFSVSAMK